MYLPMTVGMEQSEVGLLIPATMHTVVDVMDIPACLLRNPLVAERAGPLLCLPALDERLPVFPGEPLAPETPIKVFLPGGVIGVGRPTDLDMPLNRDIAEPL